MTKITKVKTSMKLTEKEYNAVVTALEIVIEEVDEICRLDVENSKGALDKFRKNKSCKFIKKTHTKKGK